MYMRPSTKNQCIQSRKQDRRRSAKCGWLLQLSCNRKSNTTHISKDLNISALPFRIDPTDASLICLFYSLHSAVPTVWFLAPKKRYISYTSASSESLVLVSYGVPAHAPSLDTCRSSPKYKQFSYCKKKNGDGSRAETFGSFCRFSDYHLGLKQ